MTVYPFEFQLGFLTVTGYGLMMMVAFLMGGWALSKETQRLGMDSGIAWDTVVFAVLGGLAGAKLYYAIRVGRVDALFSRGGLVWYGGFFGGFAAVLGYWRFRKLEVCRLLDAIAPALAAGYSLGRVGCFLVNDDYGRPTSLPWGMAFPRGAPPTTAQVLRDQYGVSLPADMPPTEILAVHPTQLYEAGLAFLVFWWLWRIRAHRHAPGWLFGLYLAAMGAERFLVEMVRVKDDRVIGPVSVAQTIAVLVMLAGALLLRRYRTASNVLTTG